MHFQLFHRFKSGAIAQRLRNSIVNIYYLHKARWQRRARNYSKLTWSHLSHWASVAVELAVCHRYRQS